MFFAVFVPVRSCPVPNFYVKHSLFIRPKKWHIVLPRPSPPTKKIREKIRIRKIQEKSQYKNPGIFEQILVISDRNGLICEEKQK